MTSSNFELCRVSWKPAADIQRPFVRYRSPDRSLAHIQCHCAKSKRVRLSVVIPTLDGDRNGCLPRLLDQIGGQNFLEYEVFVVQGDPRQGRAINIGAALAMGEYLLTLDDDTSLPDPATFARLISVMDRSPDIGMAGGNNLIPPNAPLFIQRVMREIPRRSWPMVNKITDSDLAEHPCLIMRTAEFKAIGGENELIPRGLDPYLRREFRKAGKRVVVVPGVVYHHLPPPTLRLLLKQFYRNGRDAAFVNRHYRVWVIETPSHHGQFRQQAPLAIRAFRFPLRLLSAICLSKPVWLLSELAYGFGFLCEYLWVRQTARLVGRDFIRKRNRFV